MHRRTHILVAAALALCCALAPAASADPFTDSQRKLVDEYQQQRSLGAAHSQPGPFTDSERRLVESPEVQGMVDRDRSKIHAATVAQVQAPSGGFSWGDAGIGAAGMLALFSIAGGVALLIAARRRRRPTPVG